MKKTLPILLLSSTILMSACTDLGTYSASREIYGVEESVWYQMTPDQQNRVMNNYLAEQKRKQRALERQREQDRLFNLKLENDRLRREKEDHRNAEARRVKFEKDALERQRRELEDARRDSQRQTRANEHQRRELMRLQDQQRFEEQQRENQRRVQREQQQLHQTDICRQADSVHGDWTGGAASGGGWLPLGSR